MGQEQFAFFISSFVIYGYLFVIRIISFYHEQGVPVENGMGLIFSELLTNTLGLHLNDKSFVTEDLSFPVTGANRRSIQPFWILS